MRSRVGLESLRGTWLNAAIISVCSSGFFLFGYDQGVMSGVVISEFWLQQMGNPSTIMIGTITALYDVGAALGAILAASMAERLGRKFTLILGAVVLVIGTVLMGSAHSRVQFMVARVITGVGIGYITSVTPVYQSEISPVAQRGWQVCCQLSTLLLGLMIAYWLNYGMVFHPGSVQWRFPLLFQLIFAAYVIVVTIFLPDTPRWLMRHEHDNGHENAVEGTGLEVLANLRGLPKDHDIVRKEAEEIMDAIRIEAQEEGTWMDLFRSNGISANKRFYLALGIQFMQQMTGINIVTYYAPTLFQQSLGMDQRMALYLGCYLQLWYFLASFLTWWTIDRVGRRRLFIAGALGMCAVLVAEAICVAVDNRSSSFAAVFFVFAFEACFTWGWMATVWVYPPEILPLKIRAKGAALAAGADFLGNFLVVEITPPALANIGWRSYLIWAVLNLANAVIVFCFFPETARMSLESVDKLFIDEPGMDGGEVVVKKRWYQWSVVGKADAMRRRRAIPETEEAALPKDEKEHFEKPLRLD